MVTGGRAGGAGGMLLECVEYVKAQKGEYRTLRLYGQERNLTSSAIARMNMFLHGIEDFDIAKATKHFLRNAAGPMRAGDETRKAGGPKKTSTLY